MVLLQRKLYFSKDPEGIQHFPGGVKMLISIETNITWREGGGGSISLDTGSNHEHIPT